MPFPPLSYQLSNQPKEHPELVVVKEEPCEVDNGNTQQDRTAEHSDYKFAYYVGLHSCM